MLSDGTRLQIVQMLASGERCLCDLQEAVGAYQSRLSFHLRKLKDAGMVSGPEGEGVGVLNFSHAFLRYTPLESANVLGL